MQFDIFFSLSHTPVNGNLPSEKVLLKNFFDQVKAADQLGYETAWIAESHLSSQTQKKNPHPVVPHWQGEIGINTDIFQLAHMIFDQTHQIEVGSAVMNLFTNGGPIAAAERVATFLSLHELREQNRRLKIGFSAGRFEYMSRAYGVLPRNPLEEKFWPMVKNQFFSEACEIFLKLLSKKEISSQDISIRYLEEDNFRSPQEWLQAQEAFTPKNHMSRIPIDKFYEFDLLKIVPQNFNLNLLDLIIGSHVPHMQIEVNKHLPVKVFNLSITKPEIIDATHHRMQAHYHKDGGEWQRAYMPRTTFVFINEQKNLSPKQRSQKAREEAKLALSAYWTALEGTVDPKKIQDASDNALIGTAEEISEQMNKRFHEDDTLMLWFDFFNHDSKRLIENMQAFKEKVVPQFDTKKRGYPDFLKR
ncbi:MAG: LLM class flavin-dependent oxidoreductase [Bdellovibrionales bacterium]|nr:LLM class flavin-dependent oxidoreductase [Bdellovibrionales bacterium]